MDGRNLKSAGKIEYVLMESAALSVLCF